MCHVFSSLQGHLHFLVHCFFTFTRQFFLGHPKSHFSEIQLVCDGRTDGWTDGWTDGPTDGRMDRRMDGRTYPLIEMRGRI